MNGAAWTAMHADDADPRALHVLLVEDDPGDVLLAIQALEQSYAPCHLHVVSCGEVAIGFLRRTGPYADAPRPGLILLDLNLPGRSGLDVLAEIKTDPDLKTIPVVVLTISQAPDDIVRSFELHASAYLIKPAGFGQLTDVIRQVDDFSWTSSSGRADRALGDSPLDSGHPGCRELTSQRKYRPAAGHLPGGAPGAARSEVITGNLS